MDDNPKQEWITPELIEYGDVANLTEEQAKFLGSGDSALVEILDPWVSGVSRP